MKLKHIFMVIASFAASACIATGEGTNPYVKEKINSFENELATATKVQGKRRNALAEMKEEIANSANKYKTKVSEIYAKISAGVEAAAPDLIDDWKQTRMRLEKINDVSFDMKILVGKVESDGVVYDYMNESVKGMGQIPGKTTSENAALTKILSDVARAKSSNIALAKEIESEADNGMSYISNEKQGLNDLALSIKEGRIVGSTDVSTLPSSSNFVGAVAPTQNASASKSIGDSRALITMNMSAAMLVGGVNHDEPLYQALSRALERDPSASFQIVSIAPTMDVAKKNVERVVATLTEMGMPATRISIKSNTSSTMTPQVSVYAK